MEKKKDDDITHQGHRLRLSNLIQKSGIENVSDIQAVEFFLTYIIPRGDVNPLAHRLLDRFSNFGNIVDASENELMKVKGINRRSAQKIKLFSDLMFYYSSSRMSKKLNLDNTEEFLDIVEELLRFKTTENLALFGFDFSYNFIDKRIFDRNSIDEVGVSPYTVLDFISSIKPKYVIIAHNHPGGIARTSQDDEEAKAFISNLISPFGVKLIDSLIIGIDGIYSQDRKNFYRFFRNIDDILY